MNNYLQLLLISSLYLKWKLWHQSKEASLFNNWYHVPLLKLQSFNLKQLQFNKELQNIDSALLCPLKLLQDWTTGLENYYNECQVHEAS